VLVAAAALIAGCAAPAPMIQPGSVSLDGSTPPELEQFYAQEVEWTECGSGFDCAKVEVPMNYADPTGTTIEIAVKRFNHTGDGEAVGTMFINPGGPGGSGIEMVEATTSYFSRTLRDSYDIVGFDPRGVGESHGVRCYTTEQLNEYYEQTYDLSTDAGWEAYVADATAYGEACLENTGPLMEFLDTVSAAKDLDILRGALGQETLTYFGFSYGTFLGAHYAELFPTRVGRFVLDGAVDPSLSFAELTAGQNEGFEVAYRSYLEDCLAGADCPFTGSVDEAWDRTVALLEELSANPIDSGDPDRPVSDGELINAIIMSMYSPTWWATLTETIALVLDGDGSQALLMADIAADLDDDGNYPEDEGAFRLIDCLDYPVTLDRDEITANADALVAANDLFGPYMGYGEVGCATLPFQSTAVREPITAPGTPPILVIGTTRDPATPYEWAESMADQLASGVFLGYDGDGHTAYGYGTCIDDAVDAFLVEGTVPEDGLTC
jgi:pimeloyl-ACP methyl ester carboxylesterase